MAHLLALTGLYVALVAQVALRFGGAGGWTPNLLLLAGLVSVRLRGGIVWAAAAGLICDGLTGRPLGVTMLMSTLAAALTRLSPGPTASSGVRSAATAFLAVLAVEAASRVLAATVMAEADYAAEARMALQTAAATAALVLLFAAFRGTFVRLGRRRTPPMPHGRFAGRSPRG